ncbi:MAG: hypothetical protein ACKOWF_02155 [Chloroflexota bacterium]
MFANDVIAKVGNQTSFAISVEGMGLIQPGTESDWNPGVSPWLYTTTKSLNIKPGGSTSRLFANPVLFNPEAGRPTASVHIRDMPYNDDSPTDPIRTPLTKVRMSQGDMVSCDCEELGFRILIHRWYNGKEHMDDYDEWYTRFYVAVLPL